MHPHTFPGLYAWHSAGEEERNRLTKIYKDEPPQGSPVDDLVRRITATHRVHSSRHSYGDEEVYLLSPSPLPEDLGTLGVIRVMPCLPPSVCGITVSLEESIMAARYTSCFVLSAIFGIRDGAFRFLLVDRQGTFVSNETFVYEKDPAIILLYTKHMVEHPQLPKPPEKIETPAYFLVLKPPSAPEHTVPRKRARVSPELISPKLPPLDAFNETWEPTTLEVIYTEMGGAFTSVRHGTKFHRIAWEFLPVQDAMRFKGTPVIYFSSERDTEEKRDTEGSQLYSSSLSIRSMLGTPKISYIATQTLTETPGCEVSLLALDSLLKQLELIKKIINTPKCGFQVRILHRMLTPPSL